MNKQTPISVKVAREALSRGDRLRMVVGEAPDDPTLIMYLQDGMVMAESIAGWSAGVVEPVCALESDFLEEYLQNRHSVETVRRQSHYQKLIAELAPGFNARHIEAWMRLQNPTLDGISPADFASEVAAARLMVTNYPEDSEKLAASYGL